MPYIPLKDRLRFDAGLDHIQLTILKEGLSNGDLNYLMTRLANMYIGQHGKSYNTLSDVIKAFECAKLEFYRRVVVPYEDKKIQQNGDVYDEGVSDRELEESASPGAWKQVTNPRF